MLWTNCVSPRRRSGTKDQHTKQGRLRSIPILSRHQDWRRLRCTPRCNAFVSTRHLPVRQITPHLLTAAMRFPRLVMFAVLSSVFEVAACDGFDAMTPMSPDGPQVASTVATLSDETPPRSAEPAHSFVHLSDSELWGYIHAGGRTAVVGLKQPGRNRGSYNGTVLVSTQQRAAAKEEVLSRFGIRVLG